MRVRVNETGLYTYPDVVAVCGEPVFLDKTQDPLLNPIVLVEVLSPSTERYDRTEKFEHYQALESLREVLFISQNRVRVEHYVRQDEKWILSVYSALKDVIRLEAVSATLAVLDLYDKIEFSPNPNAPKLRESC
jgi:Uma2 family endonuclease